MSKPDIFHTAHASMKAVIIYDNFAFAAKANEMLHRAANRADVAMLWTIKSWRVDALNLYRSAEEALADAMDAQLIVFAGHRTEALPSWLLNWLERWAACRQTADAAFAVIGGRNGDVLSMPANPVLSDFAERHGLKFITDDGPVTCDDEELSAQTIIENKVAPALAQSRFREAPAGIAYAGWGIND
jgi:hypothetical protein